MNIRNVLISFENDYACIFTNEYISIQEIKEKLRIYGPYYRACKNEESLKDVLKESQNIPN